MYRSDNDIVRKRQVVDISEIKGFKVEKFFTDEITLVVSMFVKYRGKVSLGGVASRRSYHVGRKGPLF